MPKQTPQRKTTSEPKSKPRPKSPAAPPPQVPATHVALLRGINVGGKNMVPMPDLARMFEAAGCKAVRTYIQSGNVLFSASPAIAKNIPATIGDMIDARLGFRPHVMVRTAEDMRRIAEANPYAGPATAVDPKALYVAFLDALPAAGDIAALDPNRSPGDRFTVIGQEVYLFLATGPIKTRLTGPYLDSTLKTRSTWRNWNTTIKLRDLLAPEG